MTAARALTLAALLIAAMQASCKEDAPSQSNAVTTCASGLESPCVRECKAGIDKSCDALSAMYLQGKGVPRSLEKSTALNKSLCEGGRHKFCASFAFALHEGSGIAADRARARKLFADHCKDDPVGCGEFGSLYLGGRGVAKDLEMGCFLAGLACKERDAQSCKEFRGYCVAAPEAGVR